MNKPVELLKNGSKEQLRHPKGLLTNQKPTREITVGWRRQFLLKERGREASRCTACEFSSKSRWPQSHWFHMVRRHVESNRRTRSLLNKILNNFESSSGKCARAAPGRQRNRCRTRKFLQGTEPDVLPNGSDANIASSQKTSANSECLLHCKHYITIAFLGSTPLESRDEHSTPKGQMQFLWLSGI